MICDGLRKNEDCRLRARQEVVGYSLFSCQDRCVIDGILRMNRYTHS